MTDPTWCRNCEESGACYCMVTVEVHSFWHASDRIEVPPSIAKLPLMDWPEEYLEQVDTLGAELTDWEIRSVE